MIKFGYTIIGEEPQKNYQTPTLLSIQDLRSQHQQAFSFYLGDLWESTSPRQQLGVAILIVYPKNCRFADYAQITEQIRIVEEGNRNKNEEKLQP